MSCALWRWVGEEREDGAEGGRGEKGKGEEEEEEGESILNLHKCIQPEVNEEY